MLAILGFLISAFIALVVMYAIFVVIVNLFSWFVNLIIGDK